MTTAELRAIVRNLVERARAQSVVDAEAPRDRLKRRAELHAAGEWQEDNPDRAELLYRAMAARRIAQGSRDPAVLAVWLYRIAEDLSDVLQDEEGCELRNGGGRCVYSSR